MANDHHEIEIKRILVGDRPIEAMTSALGAGTVARQRNFVLDTEGLDLRAARYSLRVRDEDGKYTLTAKGPSTRATASTSARPEAEIAIEAAVAQQILAGQADPLAVLRGQLSAPALLDVIASIDRVRQGKRIERIGEFDNVRRSIAVQLPSGLALTVELDTTTFPNGRIDCEAEIELDDAAQAAEVEAWLESVAARAGVRTEPAIAKVARFFQALGKPPHLGTQAGFSD